MKSNKYISWDTFFMGVARLASKRSKDPNTKCGACIVSPNNIILSVGYNGLPSGLADDGYDCDGCDPLMIPNSKNKKFDYWKKPFKYEFVVHAEENAILNCTSNLQGSRIYVYSDKGYLPCSKCARGIIQKGIREVITPRIVLKNTKTYNWDYTRHMFRQANISTRTI